MPEAAGGFFGARLAGITPEELFVNLPGVQEMLNLLQTCKSPVLENFWQHGDPFEQGVKLLGPASRIPGALESRQVFPNLLEGHAVAAIVSAGRAKREPATGECLRHNFRYLPHPIIVLGIADIEYFVMHGFARGHQDRDDGPADVQSRFY